MGKLWGAVQKKSATLNLDKHIENPSACSLGNAFAFRRLYGFPQRAEEEVGVALLDEPVDGRARGIWSLQVCTDAVWSPLQERR